MTPTHSDDAGLTPEIRREIAIDLPAHDLWALVSTPDGWRTWLVDEASIDEETGRGTVVDDGRVREVIIDTVVEGDNLTFTWWDAGDETGASQVRIAIDQHPDDRHRLTIVERPLGALHAAMSTSVSAAAIRWEVRAVSLWASSVRCAPRV